ncbi:hypothetical protein HQ560_12255 [bacterium]|nr:hypothetical protein [bacterium]
MTDANDDTQRSCWSGEEGLALDIVLVILPWALLLAVMSWGSSCGPNADPPWSLGDPHAYRTAIQFIHLGCGYGLPVYATVRAVVNQRNCLMLLVIIVSSLIAAWCAPGLYYA